MPDSKTGPTSFRASSTAREILDRAESHLGLKRSAAIEMALRTWARTIWPEPPGKSRRKSGPPA